MADTRIERLADVLVNYSTAVKPGDKVAILGSTLTAPLIKAVYAHALKAGGHPFALTSLPGIRELRFRHASDEQLEHIPEPAEVIYNKYDVGVTIWGSANTRVLQNVDPEKMKLANQALADLTNTMFQRIATKEFRWVGTQFPTNAEAQDAGMSLMEYEDFVFGACLPDMDDPVGYWRRFSAWQERIVLWFKEKQHIRVVGPETDLQLSIVDRPFLNCDGHENLPDGEICTSPVENSVEGYVYFSYPAVYQGREVAGVRLWFEKGKVVKASAEKDEAFLLQILDTDEGARFVGEFAIGTNEGINHFSKNSLFDEKINGTFHMALGAGLPEVGGENKSAIHWDMVCDLRPGGEIWVDDELLYKDGEFVIEF
ncbi:MAG: aminopeptidase [Anaerolineales bacterium]|nr:aminopeptidase [Anaerolineales bacterium]